jgi:hydroxypyruvate isomerase
VYQNPFSTQGNSFYRSARRFADKFSSGIVKKYPEELGLFILEEQMVTFAPNIGFLFPEIPFGERPRLVVKAGFDALEFGFYGQADLPAVEAACKEFLLQVVLINMDMPDWDEQNRGYLADPNLKDVFRNRLDEALNVVDRMKAHKLMLPVGAVLADMEHEEQINCIVDNLCYAAPLAADAGVLLTIEAMNPWDMVGYFLTSSGDGLEIVGRVNHPHVKFQFDTYHLQRLEGNLIQTLTDNIELIGHIQFGDVPSRSEPGTGELNFSNITTAVEKAGYEGYIGLEYLPASVGTAAVDWVPIERRSRK